MVLAVRTSELFFRYPDGTEALKGINFKAEQGERVAVIGSNGSGKSTLFYHFNGLLFPTKGEVFINEEKVSKSNLDKVRATVGLVFQDPDDQLFAPTVWDDVAFGPRNLGLSKKEVEERVDDTLRMLNITDQKNKSPDNLSGGQKRLVAIGGVLAMNPEILVLDEPTSNLDPRTSSSLIHLLLELNKELDITLIVATHDVDAVPLYADRIYVMSEGQLVAEGTPHEIFSKVSLIRSSSLRLPRIAHLMEVLQKHDGLPVGDYPLTIGEARKVLTKRSTE